MKKILFSILILATLFRIPVYAAIGTGSLSTEAKQGWAWFLNTPNQWAELEPKLIIWLETQGQEYNLQRLEANVTRKAKADQIKSALRGLSDAKIDQILAIIGS